MGLQFGVYLKSLGGVAEGADTDVLGEFDSVELMESESSSSAPLAQTSEERAKRNTKLYEAKRFGFL
jgi:hypothetical protein